MYTSRHIRLTFLSVFVLCLVVALSSCTKKNVRSSGDIGGSGDAVGEAISGEDSVSSSSLSGSGSSDGLQTVYFDYDRFSLRSDARETLKANAEWMKANGGASIQIEGHCDERGTIEYNLGLGERRANAIKNALVRWGIDSGRISIISYGEERLANSGTSEAAHAENRRAEFVVLSQ